MAEPSAGGEASSGVTSTVGPDQPTGVSVLDGGVLDDPLRALQHVLLSTDGTVVRLLEGCFGERIRLADHVQCSRPATPTDPPELELEDDEPVLHRKVVLEGARTGRTYVSGDSLVAIDRLPAEVAEPLLSTSKPIGHVLIENRVETFREILRMGRTRSADGAGDDSEMLFRTYRIVIGGRPTMLITEEFIAFSTPGALDGTLVDVSAPGPPSTSPTR